MTDTFDRLSMRICKALASQALFLFMIFSLTPAEAMQIQKVKSKKGIEAWLVEDHSRPILSLQFAFLGGASQDPKDKPGVATFVSSMLDEGAGDLSSEAFQQRLEDLAAKMTVTASADTVTGSFQTLTQNRAASLKLLKIALTSPHFAPDDVERIREQIVTIVKADEKDPDKVAAQTWLELAFGDHPYARPTNGTLPSVAAIKADDLREFVKRNFARDNLKVAVVGDADPATLSAILDDVFGDLPEKSDLKPVADVTWPTRAKQKIVSMHNPQSVAHFGFQGLMRKDPDFVPAFVLNYTIGGGGFASKLMHEVREKRGLAYSVYSYLNPEKHAGIFAGAVATENKGVGQSLEVIKNELELVVQDGITEKELRAAKDYLIGSYALRFDTSVKIAAQLLAMQVDDFDVDYITKRNAEIEAVTLDDVKRVAKRLLESKSLIVTIVGEPEGVKETGL
jgi:zinc protease